MVPYYSETTVDAMTPTLLMDSVLSQLNVKRITCIELGCVSILRQDENHFVVVTEIKKDIRPETQLEICSIIQHCLEHSGFGIATAYLALPSPIHLNDTSVGSFPYTTFRVLIQPIRLNMITHSQQTDTKKQVEGRTFKTFLARGVNFFFGFATIFWTLLLSLYNYLSRLRGLVEIVQLLAFIIFALSFLFSYFFSPTKEYDKQIGHRVE